MEGAIRGKCPLYCVKLQFLNNSLGSRSIMLMGQSPKSVSINPIGPGHTPCVFEKMQDSGLILSMKYLSSEDRVTVVSGGMLMMRAGEPFCVGKTGNGDILYIENVGMLVRGTCISYDHSLSALVRLKRA